ncbi:sulfite exporter TauE/SafE family protein [Thalassotalea sp. M1531]|uniref:Probable membrane transporter protein n=1 Tax=Thalassotalea algicola TaxID=2716224 RepID=A0A7Y0Q915_9GAMM|nr:sulfite exporter TauE/SafE family protein [Thalassotalea algicola]NMP32720.1 sulfite exporter TauE/SafE family protein [Thalassotalea algicola]
MELTFTIILLINVVVFLGSLLQGLIGYGVGMFCAPLLFLINPSLVPAPLILISTVLTILMMVRDKSHLQFDQIAWAMKGGFIGVVLAGLVLKVTTKDQFELFFGLLILCAVIISLLGFKPKVNKKTNLIAGFSSGFMGALTAVGGPPIALLYQNGAIKNIVANLTAFFLFLNFVAIVTFAAIGQITTDTLIVVVVAIPGVVLGLFISTKAQGIVKAHLARRWILALSAITAVITIIRALDYWPN